MSFHEEGSSLILKGRFLCYFDPVIIYAIHFPSSYPLKAGDSMGNGYSRMDIFGDIIHYDEHGNKIGESRENFFGGYTNYDAKGNKIGSSEETFLGDGYVHYDTHGNKIGTSYESAFGGYKNYDNRGHYTGSTDRSIFDELPPEEWTGGSIYRKSWDPPSGSGYSKSQNSPAGSGYSRSTVSKTTDTESSSSGRIYSRILYAAFGLVCLVCALTSGSHSLSHLGLLIFMAVDYGVALALIIGIAVYRKRQADKQRDETNAQAEKRYRFCRIFCDDNGEFCTVYDPTNELKAHERVLVCPKGQNSGRRGEIISLLSYTRSNLPYPIEQEKYWLIKLIE